jgi:hypothetical protein
MTLTNSHLIALAEDYGFKRCHPEQKHGDPTARWLRGGGLWEEHDVAGFMRDKAKTDTQLRLKAAGFIK